MKFSIVVPSYNAQDTLSETLDSVLAQRYGDWECVVVDDGSTDRTLEIARDYATREPRVRVVTQENRGTAGAYNTGVTAAAGDYIVILSADDLLLPEHLQEMDRVIRAGSDTDIWSSNGYFLHPDGSWELVYDDLPRAQEWTLRRVIQRCFFGVGAVYRRGVFDAVGGYRQGIYGEDYDFWLRAMAQGARHYYVPLALSLHRVSDAQKSSDLERVFQCDIRILRDLEEVHLLTRSQSRSLYDAVSARLRMAALLDTNKVRGAFRFLRVYLSRPATVRREVWRSCRLLARRIRGENR